MEYKRLTFRYESVDGTKQVGYTEKLIPCFNKQTMILNRLAELEDKIEQGTLLELACKKGDKVYQADCVRVYELTVLGIRVFNNKFYYETQGVGFDNTAIGQSIFLTREEAEKCLKEKQV